MWLAPSGPPQELNVTDIEIHEINIGWKFPQFPNGIIIGFTVSTVTFYVSFYSKHSLQVYYNTSVLSVSTSDCDISTLSCSTTINNLASFTPYIIEVSCNTQGGEGPRTNSVRIITSIGSELIHVYTQ